MAGYTSASKDVRTTRDAGWATDGRGRSDEGNKRVRTTVVTRGISTERRRGEQRDRAGTDQEVGDVRS